MIYDPCSLNRVSPSIVNEIDTYTTVLWVVFIYTYILWSKTKMEIFFRTPYSYFFVSLLYTKRAVHN